MADENSKDEKWSRWFTSIEKMMFSTSCRHFKASSIFSVPEQLRRSKEEAYTPKVVSIGPLHSGTRRDLLFMEEIKWHCLQSLLHRTKDVDQSLRRCSEAMYAFDKIVRATYVDEIKFNSYDLAKIMLLDGCFLLELLISNDKELNSKIKSSSPGRGAEVGKMELVRSDLKLLENQIPLFILTNLFKILFVKDPQEEHKDGVEKMVNGLVLFFFGCTSASSPINGPNRCAHILELIHWFMTREEEGIYWDNNHRSITVQKNFQRSNTNLKLERCISRLQATTGVTIRPLYVNPEERGTIWLSKRLEDREEAVNFGYYKKFNTGTGVLNMQRFHATETTEIHWRNLIAWEQNRITHEKFILGKQGTQTRTRCKFSQYAILFKGLVCCEHDIHLLKDENVLIANRDVRSNEYMMTFFHEIADKIQIDANMDTEFRQLIKDLNTCSAARGNRKILWHSVRWVLTNTRYKCRTIYAIPAVWKMMGVITVIVLLALTIGHTIFAAKIF